MRSSSLKPRPPEEVMLMMMSALLADEADGLLEPVQRHGGLVLVGAHVDVGDGRAGLIGHVDLFGDLFGLVGR